MGTSDERYLGLVKAIDGIVWEAHAETANFTFVSEKAEQLLGYPCSDWLQPGFWASHIHPDDREWAVTFCQESTLRQEAHEFEYRFMAANGDVVWLRDLVSVICENGKPSWLRGIMIDVTQHKETELHLIESQTLLKNFLEGANAGTWEWNVQTSDLKLNEVWANLLGYRLQELEPTSIQTWKNLTHPTDLAYAEKLLEKHFNDESKQYDCKIRMQHKNGNWVWIHTRGRVITRTSDNQPLMMFGTHFDVTEAEHANIALEKSERRQVIQQQEQQQILDNMVDGIITIDEEGTMLTFNKSAASLFGYRLDDVIGNNVKMLMDEPYHSEHDDYLKNYLSTGKASVIGIGREVKARTKQGKLFPMRLSVAELPSTESGKRRFIGSCHNLTAEKEQEKQLHRSMKMEALATLVGGITHDFNNILGIITGYTEMLEALCADNPTQTKYVNEIITAGERASQLTKKLLNFSSKEMTSASATDLNSIISNESMIFEKALTPSIELCLELSDDTWPIWSEEGDVYNALLNMAINAAHAMPTGGKLTIQTHNTTFTSKDQRLLNIAPGDYVQLSVIDNGCGMDEKTLQKIFDPFYTTKGDTGTGLGLAQVYAMVQRSGGIVRVYSELGQGTQFNLFFPRYQSQQQKTSDNKVETYQNNFGSESILVVDDETQLRELMFELLSSKGYKTKAAANADEALNLMEHHHFDLVISDIVMPGMSGTELATYIKRRYPQTRIQFISGYSDERHVNSGNDELYQKRLYKPIRQRELLQCIRDLLDQ